MLGSPLKKYSCALELSEHWYNYPLKSLVDLPEDRAVIVKFDGLVNNAEETILRIYRQYGFSVPQECNALLDGERKKAREHKSQHV